MAYIWENYKTDKKFTISEEVSPYLELWDNSEKTVNVNIFFRLSELLFPSSFTKDEKSFHCLWDQYQNNFRYKEIANLLLHAQAQLDRKKGMTVIDILAIGAYQEIQLAVYGEWLRDAFESLELQDKIIILDCLARYNLSGQRTTFFDEAIFRCFAKTQIYYEKSTTKLYIYIEEEKEEKNLNKFAIIEYLFKDIELKTEIMWKREHFGIIGIEQTMKIEEIAMI